MPSPIGLTSHNNTYKYTVLQKIKVTKYKKGKCCQCTFLFKCEFRFIQACEIN